MAMRENASISMRPTASIAATAALLCVLVACIAFIPAHAVAATRATDVDVASEGNELVGVPGTFTSEKKAALLKQVNKIRREACEQGVPDPRDPSSKLRPSDYVPIKWSAGLEEVAQTRAAEASVLQDHERPNGNLCFSTEYDTQSYGEVLAWNNSASISGGIEQWYEEKSDWVKRNENAVTGHYTSLIDPDNTYIGLGGFLPSKSTSSWGAVAGEFNSDASADEAQRGQSGSCTQVMEVESKYVSYKVAAKKVALNSSAKLKVTCALSTPGIWGDVVETRAVPHGSLAWSSADQTIATVDSGGAVTGLAPGTTTIKAQLGSRVANARVTVIDPATVTTVTVNAAKVTRASVDKAIAGACGSAAHVKTIVLGKKVGSIGARAFAGTKAKTIVVKTKKLTKKSVKSSLAGSKVTTVKVEVGGKAANRKLIRAYKKVFDKKVCGKKVTVK